ncbi:hypothetical protein GCM10012278_83880 [Nonomuraea glycinis]|uniref:Uncharacterized protein n=1 Tax=Nonomuraea glycinis TaxID=2047744 RepID=A0A918EAY3_9ACTN|nr:hypothetical protein GCM10012278_83880 [Nonomuraea glycinis]
MLALVRIRTCSGGPASFSPRQAAQQRREGDAHLDAGQLLADALVDAVPEGQVALGRVGEVQPVGVGEAAGVAVGDRQ